MYFFLNAPFGSKAVLRPPHSRVIPLKRTIKPIHSEAQVFGDAMDKGLGVFPRVNGIHLFFDSPPLSSKTVVTIPTFSSRRSSGEPGLVISLLMYQLSSSMLICVRFPWGRYTSGQKYAYLQGSCFNLRASSDG